MVQWFQWRIWECKKQMDAPDDNDGHKVMTIIHMELIFIEFAKNQKSPLYLWYLVGSSIFMQYKQ